MRHFKTENEYQSYLIKELKKIYGEDFVIKIPGNVLQGIADIEVTHGCKYARLEAKRSFDEPHQPNQDYRIEEVNAQGAFARFIYPENQSQVLKELDEYFNK